MTERDVPPINPLPFAMTLGRRLPAGVFREVRAARALACQFNAEVVRPRALELDARVLAEPDHLPWEIAREAARRGFYSLWLPKAFGGGGYGALSMQAFNEELASECLGIANLIGSHYVGLALVSATFNLRVLRRLTREIVLAEKSEKPCLVSTAITEPDAGSDMEDVDLIDRGRVTCRAERVEGGYRVTGSKMFISNGHLSAWHIVSAFTDLARPSLTTVVLAVPSSSAGFSLGRIERKLGQHACPASVLSFDGCFVPDELVCLAPPASAAAGDGVHRDVSEMLVDDVLALSRPGVAALAAGAARGLYNEALAWALEADPACATGAGRGWVQAALSEMRKNADLARTYAWEAGVRTAVEGPFRAMTLAPGFTVAKWLPGFLARAVLGPLLSSGGAARKMRLDRLAIRRREADSEYSAEASIAKFAATELAAANVRLAMELTGQSGTRSARRIEKIARDARLLQIYEGTNDLNRINAFKQRQPEVPVFSESSGP